MLLYLSQFMCSVIIVCPVFTLSCLSIPACVVSMVLVLLKYEYFVQVLHVSDICKILPEYTAPRPRRE
jgi:hypothetical protein